MEVVIYASALFCPKSWETEDVLPVLRLGSFGKKNHMWPWLLLYSLFLKQMWSVHYFGTSALWSFQKCPVKMPILVVREVCLQLVEKQISVPKFFFKKDDSWWPMDVFLEDFFLFIPPWPSPIFCEHFWSWQSKENLFSLSLLETISV